MSTYVASTYEANFINMLEKDVSKSHVFLTFPFEEMQMVEGGKKDVSNIVSILKRERGCWRRVPFGVLSFRCNR